MKIIAQRLSEDVYLIDLDVTVNGIDQGSIVEPATGRSYPSQGIHSILARGYWNEYTGDETVEEILIRCRNNSILA